MKYKYIRFLVFMLFFVVFDRNAVIAQNTLDTSRLYDFYNFRWTGLLKDSFENAATSSCNKFSNIVMQAIPVEKRRSGNFNALMAQKYRQRNKLVVLPTLLINIVNFVTRDENVVTFHCFVVDSNYCDSTHWRVKYYFTSHAIGNSDKFNEACHRLKDSLAFHLIGKEPYLDSLKRVTEGCERLLGCLFMDKKEYFTAPPENPKPRKNEILKKYNLKNTVKAFDTYWKYGETQYFRNFDSTFNKTRDRKEFEEDNPYTWYLIQSIASLHNMGTHLRDIGKAGTSPDDKELAKEKYQNSKAQLKENTKLLNSVKMTKEEEKIWKPVRRKLDDLANKLLDASMLLSNCQNFLERALEYEKEKNYVDAVNLYMLILANSDVDAIINNSHYLKGESSGNCSGLKQIASNRIDTLREKMKISYTAILNYGDSIANSKKIKDTLLLIDTFQRMSWLNSHLSAHPMLKTQELYELMADSLNHCTEVEAARNYYLRALTMIESARSKDIVRKLEELKLRTCTNPKPFIDPKNFKPIAGLRDSIVIQKKSGDKDKRFLADIISNILLYNLKGKVQDASLIGKETNFSFKDGIATFALSAKEKEVNGFLNEMSFPLGEYVGNEYIEKQVIAKLAKSIVEICEKSQGAIEYIKIRHIGSADGTQFKTSCLLQKDEYIGDIKWDILEDKSNDFYSFEKIVCAGKYAKNMKDRSKGLNLALAYIRGYRRYKLLEEEIKRLSRGLLPIIIQCDPKYDISARVAEQEKSPQYRYVNTTIEIKLKQEFNFKVEVDYQ